MRLVAIGNHYNASKHFRNMFNDFVIIEVGDTRGLNIINKSDVVLFCGGEDISPSIYKQKPSRHTGARVELSDRDNFEVMAFNIAQSAGAKMLGICRGAQLLCALSGGSLYQHVNHHSGRDHNMRTVDGFIIPVCSVHHQMMNPEQTKHELIGWAEEILSNVHLVEGEKNIDVEVEPEIVFFKDTKALAIQYHPEFMSQNDTAVSYARELVSKYIMVTK